MLAAIHIRQTLSPAGHLTVAALTYADGAVPTTEIFTRPGATDEARYAAGLDAVARLIEATSFTAPARVHITDGGLRRELTLVAASFPTLVLVDSVRGPMLTLVEQAAVALDAHAAALRIEHVEHDRKPVRDRPTLLVATDASKSSRRRGVGVACVSNERDYHQEVYPQTKSVLAGELRAIELALLRFRDRQLHIVTDSKRAITCLEMRSGAVAREYDAESAEVAAHIRDLSQGGKARVSWVKGHSGHVLNETADRLAVSARRIHEAGLPEPSRRAIAANIMASLAIGPVPA